MVEPRPVRPSRNVSARSYSEPHWNYEPCYAVRVVVKLPSFESPPAPPLAWWKEFAGQERDAVHIISGDFPNEDGEGFLIDDDHGQGWGKIMAGGGPEWGHKGLPDKCEILREREV